MSDFMSPGRRIRHYRMLRGMTQKALGIAAGFPPETADIFLCQVGTKKILRIYKAFIGGQPPVNGLHVN